jgi:enoyl-[acyl-carrier protein] reductase I
LKGFTDATAPLGLLAGKRILVTGVANHRSIAWAVARACAYNGAEVGLTYQNATFEKRVVGLADEIGAKLFGTLDVLSGNDIEQLKQRIKLEWGELNGFVHALAFARKEALSGRYIDVSLNQFEEAMQVSCFSLTDLSRALSPLMLRLGGSIVTMTSYGSEKVLPRYGLMGVAKAALESSVRYLAADLGEIGIRINAISAGPIKTISAGSIVGFKEILEWNRTQSLLRRNVTPEEIANAAVYLLSSMSSATTGEIIHVDSGHHAQGMLHVRPTK